MWHLFGAIDGTTPSLFTNSYHTRSYRIISDDIQTPAGRSLWNNLRRTQRVYIIDTTTGEIHNDRGVPEDDIYTYDDILGKRYRLMFEGSVSTPNPIDYTHPKYFGCFG